MLPRTAIPCILVFCLFGVIDAEEAVVSEVVNPEDGPEDHGETQPLLSGKNENGDEIVEGDMAFHNKEEAQNRNAIKSKNRKWPKDSDGKVYIGYEFSSYLGSRARSAVENAIKDFDKYSCIRFVKRSDQREYLEFFRGGGCWSYVGDRHWAPQQVSLGNGCEYKGIAAHEMMHALGFDHEQTRPDRDEYVTIRFENIQSGLEYNFEHCQDCTTQGKPYDYSSVMHYGRTAFSRNGRDTIVPKKSGVTLGQRRGLTKMDFEKLNKLYGCEDTETVSGSESGSGASCDDRCGKWAKNGACDAYPAYMDKYCPDSCEECGGGGGGGSKKCKDRTDCSRYIKSQCRDKAMDYWCPKFCGKCA